MTSDNVPAQYRAQAEQVERIASSYETLIGKPLVEGDDPVAALWGAAPAIVAHGTEADPIFFFGNRSALKLFETDLATFTAMPSRLSAEASLRAERDALMDRVRANGFIDDYSGIRISASAKRFRIEQATVWNLNDETGAVHGQAAAFDQWSPID